MSAGCASGTDAAARSEPPSASPSTWAFPTPIPSDAYQPPPLEDPTDPVLIAYCSAQDRVVALEGRLLTDPPSTAEAVRAMRKAQRAAALTIPVFGRADERTLERLAQDWTNSFDEVIARLEHGQRPINALRPAISTLGAIERRFSCELDG